MRKLILIILIFALAVALIWWLPSVFKKPAPSTEILPKESSLLITKPPPDTTDALLEDDLNEAIKDIEALE